MTCQQRPQCLIEQGSIGDAPAQRSSLSEQLLIDGRTDADSTHATIMPPQCYTRQTLPDPIEAYCLKLRGDSASGQRSARSATAGCSGAELVSSPLVVLERQSGRVCRPGEGDGAKADLKERFSTESRSRLLDDCYHQCPGRFNCPPSVGVRLGQNPDRGKCAKSHESRNLLAP